MKKILIVYTSGGYGHKKIAENFAEALKQGNEVELLDLFQLEKGKLVDGGFGLYLWMLRTIPWLWEFFYTNKVFLALTLPLRTVVAGFRSKKLASVVQKGYDVIISTEVNPSSILSYLKKKGKFTAKFVVSFSDFHLHCYWLFDNVDLYLANIPEQKEQMIKLGIRAEKIVVCGITLSKSGNIDKQAVKQKLGLDLDKKVVLVLGGGRGLGFNDKLIQELKNVDNAEVLIVCGKNQLVYETLTKFYRGQNNIHILGFINNMDELYAIADLAITKPGGLSIAECLNFSLPILISEYIPGQERLNFEYLISKNLILGLNSLDNSIQRALSNMSFREALANNPARTLIVQHGDALKKAIESL